MPSQLTPEEARSKLPPIYTLYDHPRDFPEYAVVRIWYGNGYCYPYAIVYRNLEEARAAMEQNGLFCLPREPGDDPCIVESWI